MSAADPVFPLAVWFAITRLGEAQLLLPSALALIAWLVVQGERHSAALWFGLLVVAIAITTATKIAFLGWGIGSARWDFAGISGHVMFAATVFPLLLRGLAAESPVARQRAAVALGYSVALLVAVSRVVLGQHSVSEVLAGLALGGAASALALGFGSVPRRSLPRWLLLGLLLWMVGNPTAVPPAPTHGLVTRLALAMSGREKPYTRGEMMRRERIHRLVSDRVAAPYNASAVLFFTSSITAYVWVSRTPGSAQTTEPISSR